MELMIRGRKIISDSYLYSCKINRDWGGKCRTLQGLFTEAPVQIHIHSVLFTNLLLSTALETSLHTHPINITTQEVQINLSHSESDFSSCKLLHKKKLQYHYVCHNRVALAHRTKKSVFQAAAHSCPLSYLELLPCCGKTET